MDSPSHRPGVETLGWFSAASLVVANMVGVGVFTTSGFLLKDLEKPSLVLFAWMVGGIIAFLGAMCYASLGKQYPRSGGEYWFISKTLHPAFGFLAGWISLFVGFSAPLAAAAYGLEQYTQAWFPASPPLFISTGSILALTALHAFRLKPGALTQNILVAIKILALLIFLMFGLAHLPASSRVSQAAATPTGFPYARFAVSLVWISFSYSGWNAAVYIAGEIKSPKTNLPRAIFVGTAFVTALYIALNYIFIHAASPETLAGQLHVGTLAARAIGGDRWANFLTGIIALALLTSISSLIMAGPRVYSEMAKDKFLPSLFIGNNQPPTFSIFGQSLIALVLLWSATFESLITYIGFTLSFSTVLTVIGLIRAHLKEGVPILGWPWAPGIFIAANLYILLFTFSRHPTPSLLSLLTLFLGTAIGYTLLSRR